MPEMAGMSTHEMAVSATEAHTVAPELRDVAPEVTAREVTAPGVAAPEMATTMTTTASESVRGNQHATDRENRNQCKD